MQKINKDVAIRTFTAADIENKIKWINDPANNAYLHYDIPLEYAKTLAWFEKKNDDFRCDLVIEYLGEPVGLIGLLGIDRINKKAEYYISMGNTALKRKGIGFTASLLVLKYAFMDLNLNKVYLNVDADNVAACSMYEKLGFVCEGYFKQDMFHRGALIDRKRYAFLKENFKCLGVQ